MTQEELLPLILKKDDKAFTLMYDMYSKNLYGVIYNLINDREEAEDVLQEVFVKKLKPKCIQIINLLFFKGYTQQEASDELEIPLGTVKTQNRNCINDLRNFLQV